MMYQGKSELNQATPENTASFLLRLFYIVIIVCISVFFMVALDYGLDISFGIK